jgi:hypothetical protein
VISWIDHKHEGELVLAYRINTSIPTTSGAQVRHLGRYRTADMLGYLRKTTCSEDQNRHFSGTLPGQGRRIGPFGWRNPGAIPTEHQYDRRLQSA